jgi:aminopeptidase N
MLRNRLGDEAFWKGIERYGTENKFHSVETVDLRRSLERATDRDLERFFYDWLERPGNPELEVTTEYLPDSRQARIDVKQTQAGEPFHLPLKIVLTCARADAPTVLEEEMTGKQLTLQVPLPAPPERVDVDPDQTVLMELKETKSRALWSAQLLQAPSVPARLRGTEHFAQSKTEEDHELLAKAFASEKFWGVKVEIAKALGNAKDKVAKQALLQGLQQSDARIRKACIDSLAKFEHDADVAAVLKQILQKGDPSYAVESAALMAYAKQAEKDALAVITPWITKPSHQDTLAGAALTASGMTHDPAVLDSLMSWTQPDKPRSLRTAAQLGLVELVRSKQLTDAQRQQIVKSFVTTLEETDRSSRFAVLRALPELGPLAASALPVVEKMIQDESRPRLKEMLKGVADKIRAQAGTTPATAELNQLREEVIRLQREQDDLRKRLDKYEKVAR